MDFWLSQLKKFIIIILSLQPKSKAKAPIAFYMFFVKLSISSRQRVLGMSSAVFTMDKIITLSLVAIKKASRIKIILFCCPRLSTFHLSSFNKVCIKQNCLLKVLHDTELPKLL